MIVGFAATAGLGLLSFAMVLPCIVEQSWPGRFHHARCLPLLLRK